MARTNRKPGPKPRYGKRREYHMLLEAQAMPGEAMSLADAFEQAAKAYEIRTRQQAETQGLTQKETTGIVAYFEQIVKERPEIRALLLTPPVGEFD